jgi:capsular polysaccharide biosynthesis protein
MLQSYGSPQSALYEEPGQSFDLAFLIGIFKRRIFYFAIPFLLIAMLGFGVVAIQRPIYRAEGKILVQSPEIPPELVHPTITEVANERVQVIKQRIMARDNLMAVVNKFNLFPRERGWLSSTELLDLVRSRMEIQPVALDAQIAVPGNPTIAFTLNFDYEDPALAMGVANAFLTSILTEDANTRTSNAAETTQFLDREVKRLAIAHDAVIAQLQAAKQRPPDPEQAQSEETKAQLKDLADAEASLTQASAIYSDEYPIVKNLRKKIVALKHSIAATAATRQSQPAADKSVVADVNVVALERQEADLDKSLEDANRKLNTARLGESMERGQQGERLEVIEQPSLPQKPVRPQRLKWYAVAFALAGMIGAGTVVTAEMLDGSIRGSRDLSGVIDRHLIVNIPYLSTPGEDSRRRRKLVLLCVGMVAVLAAAIAAAVIKGVSIDFSWFDRPLLDSLTRVLH